MQLQQFSSNARTFFTNDIVHQHKEFAKTSAIVFARHTPPCWMNSTHESVDAEVSSSVSKTNLCSSFVRALGQTTNLKTAPDVRPKGQVYLASWLIDPPHGWQGPLILI